MGPWGLLVVALPALLVPQSASLWVRPHCHESPLPWLPVSAPPTGLDECFFISLVVGLRCSLICCQFWLFFDFKLWLSFFLLCEEVQCVYPASILVWDSSLLFSLPHYSKMVKSMHSRKRLLGFQYGCHSLSSCASSGKLLNLSLYLSFLMCEIGHQQYYHHTLLLNYFIIEILY